MASGNRGKVGASRTGAGLAAAAAAWMLTAAAGGAFGFDGPKALGREQQTTLPGRAPTAPGAPAAPAAPRPPSAPAAPAAPAAPSAPAGPATPAAGVGQLPTGTVPSRPGNQYIPGLPPGFVGVGIGNPNTAFGAHMRQWYWSRVVRDREQWRLNTEQGVPSPGWGDRNRWTAYDGWSSCGTGCCGDGWWFENPLRNMVRYSEDIDRADPNLLTPEQAKTIMIETMNPQLMSTTQRLAELVRLAGPAAAFARLGSMIEQAESPEPLQLLKAWRGYSRLTLGEFDMAAENFGEALTMDPTVVYVRPPDWFTGGNRYERAGYRATDPSAGNSGLAIDWTTVAGDLVQRANQLPSAEQAKWWRAVAAMLFAQSGQFKGAERQISEAAAAGLPEPVVVELRKLASPMPKPSPAGTRP